MEKKQELYAYFKSILEMERTDIVICNLEHEIIYVNPAAAQHHKMRGRGDILGRNLLDCHNEKSREMIFRVVEWFKASPDNNLVYTAHYPAKGMDTYMIALRGEDGELIGYYEKHEYRNPETMKLYDME